MTHHETDSSNTSDCNDADTMRAVELVTKYLLLRLRPLREPQQVFLSLLAHHNMRELPTDEQEAPIGNNPDTR